MEPKDIENPESEEDFRHQLRAEKGVIKISSKLPVIKSLPADSEIEYLIKQKFSLGLTGDDYEKSANKEIIDAATVSEIKICKWFRDYLAGNVL